VSGAYEVIRQEPDLEDQARKSTQPGYKVQIPLLAIYRRLVVLDEGHRISNPKTSLARAAQKILAEYRLALTGTPLQNEYTDAQSLMSFLDIAPWKYLKDYNKVSRSPR
jgi:SNF2 family DNA or RNA helicase